MWIRRGLDGNESGIPNGGCPTYLADCAPPITFSVTGVACSHWWDIRCWLRGDGTSPDAPAEFDASNPGMNPDGAPPSGLISAGVGGTGGQPPKTGLLMSIKQKFCSAIPHARTVTLDAGIGGLGSTHGSVQATLNYITGKTSFSAAAGFQGGWNGVVSASVSVGFVYGASNSNQSTSYSVPSAVSGYYSKIGAAREVGLGIGWGLLGKYSFGVTKSLTSQSIGSIPGLMLPFDSGLIAAKQVCQ